MTPFKEDRIGTHILQLQANQQSFIYVSNNRKMYAQTIQQTLQHIPSLN